MEMPLEFRLPYFRELIRCGHELYSWSLDEQFHPISNNCPNPILGTILSMSRIEQVLKSSDYDASVPLIFTSPLGLLWVIGCIEGETAESRVYHLIGPAFFDSVSHQAIYAAMQKQKLSSAIQEAFVAVMDQIPVVPVTKMFEYALMLHYTLTGERITNSELQIRSAVSNPKKMTQADNSHGTWAMEQALLKPVEEGNLDYMKIRGRLTSIGNVGKMVSDNPLRQVKNQIIVYTALCTRAAIRGGLSPEIAYTLSDRYIQMAETCESVSDLAEVGHTMQEDFIRRVHRVKTEAGISKQVLMCQSYIQLHVTEKITLEDLAKLTNYSVYHISKKFRNESGMTIMEYWNHCRVERAKELLISCQDSIQSISDQLGFGAQSYFGSQFKKYTGMSAGEFRKQYGKENTSF